MTEYLAKKNAADSSVVMMIYNKNLSVSPITTHLPLKKIFKDPSLVCKKIGIDDKLRPQNLSSDIYFRICKEYEDLID